MQKEKAVFAGGCFWCTEAIFKALRGVVSVVPGYTGGAKANPTYEEVCSGTTGHAEAVKIEFDPAQVSYESLLTVFFGTHDPTTRNRQGNDVGTQYRSAVFYSSPAQKAAAEKMIADINASSAEGGPVVTEVAPLGEFYEAEDYHKDYFSNHPENPYCELVINPKLDKVQKEFYALLKDKKI